MTSAQALLDLRPAKVTAEFLVNQKNDSGWSSLLFACISNSTALVQLLLQNDADVNAVTRENQTALHIAAAKG